MRSRYRYLRFWIRSAGRSDPQGGRFQRRSRPPPSPNSAITQRVLRTGSGRSSLAGCAEGADGDLIGDRHEHDVDAWDGPHEVANRVGDSQCEVATAIARIAFQHHGCAVELDIAVDVGAYAGAKARAAG